MGFKQWVIKHPAAAFTVLTLTWSWGIWAPLLFMIEPSDTLSFPPAAIPFVLVGNAGPTLIGVALTAALYGRRGLGALGARLRDARAGRWWLALLVIPLTYGLTPLLRRAAGYPVELEAIAARVGPGLGIAIFACLTEELGWRGFLLPQLLRRHTPLAAALLVGLVWGGLWHGYINYLGLGGKGWAFWPLNLLQGLMLLSAWSLVLTRVYQHTRGSLLLSLLMHVSISASAFITGQTYASIGEELTWAVIGVGLAWLVSGSFWLATRPASAARPLPAA